jgi:hypothetical protein
MTRPPIRLRDMPSRREVLRWVGAGVAGAAIGPLGCAKKSAPPWTPEFFTEAERSALGALADVVLPPDDKPGGSALGAVAFIEKLASVYDAPTAVPEIFAGGPYSGRAPFANWDGTASIGYPANDFENFLALDRVADFAWRLYLYGSDGVPGGGPNDAVLGKTIGLRDQLKTGLQSAMALSPTPLQSLDPTTRATLFNKLDPNFQLLLQDLVPQAAFAAPEYGGNPNLAGWEMVHYEGDQQPLGFSEFDNATGISRERPDAPVSKPNPGPDPEPMDDSIQQFLTEVTQALGGTVFK